jgi:subtilisin family serine protease
MWPYPGPYSVPAPTAERPLYENDPAVPQGMSGNMIPWNFWYHNIPQAWSVASGAGITVGVVDTGVFQDQSLLQPTGFNGGASSGRTVVNLGTSAMSQSPYDQCGHGTRVAGTIAAPRNWGCPTPSGFSDPTTVCRLGTGLNIVGVAWNANLVTVRTMNDVVIWPGDEFSVRTSDAAAVTSGIAALVWSRFPASTPEQVKDRLLLTAKPYSSAGDWGHGSPDAYAAVTTTAFIQVPNVVGLPATNARSAIRSAGLVPIEVSGVGTCENSGNVINQSPRAVDLALPGSSVTMTVAAKPPNCP